MVSRLTFPVLASSPIFSVVMPRAFLPISLEPVVDYRSSWSTTVKPSEGGRPQSLPEHWSERYDSGEGTGRATADFFWVPECPLLTWEFLRTAAPLAISGGTGSPINPNILRTDS